MKSKIIELLSIEKQLELDALFYAARSGRTTVFGNKIFLYGFVYFSTWCKNNCNFCYYRKSNDIERYRKEPEEIVSIAKQLADSGVNLIDLTMGEDLIYHDENFESVLEMTKQIKLITGLPVMISPGVINNELIDKFAAIGTDWYALYQETHNKELFKKLRLNQSYEERMNAKLHARDQGMFIEEGILAGIGESLEDIADSILMMGKIKAKQIRVMSFIPQKGIPMENVITPNRNLELKIIAIMRLLYPQALIPASLDVDGIKGLRDRVNAGANVVTSIIPPKSGFAGVAQKDMDVDEGGRSVQEARIILKDLGLDVASTTEYKDYLKELKMREIKN